MVHWTHTLGHNTCSACCGCNNTPHQRQDLLPGSCKLCAATDRPLLQPCRVALTSSSATTLADSRRRRCS